MAAPGTRDESLAGDRADDLPKDREDNLTDDDLESEIELVSELVVAATSSDRRLPQQEVDQLLGIKPRADQSVDQPKRPEM